MKLWITLAGLSVLLVIVLLLLFGLYVAVVSGAADFAGLGNVLRTEASPPSPEILARNQATRQRIQDAIEDQSAFYLELSDEDLTALLASRLDSTSQIRDVNVRISPEGIKFAASLNGVIGVPSSGYVQAILERGEISLILERASVGVLGVPGGVQQDIETLINQAIGLDELFQEYGATMVQQVRLEDGRAIIVGVQRTGFDISVDLQQALQESVASSGGSSIPAPPGANVVPPGTVAGTSNPGDEVYLALGDSLAANVGVNDPREGYVSRFHGYLERETGRPLGLRNLGVSGESSISIYQGQLSLGLGEIERLRNDANPDTRVSVVTLDIGANDLLGHIKSEDCVVSPAGQTCQSRLDAGLQNFRGNFSQIVPDVLSAIEPDTEFYIMTVYNPFALGTGLPLESLSNDITDQLNSVIMEIAQDNNVAVADVRPIMGSNSGVWTNILSGDVHPNAKGYQAMAFSLTQSREQ